MAELAAKPKFDPSKPFEAVKPAFDPNKPYEPVTPAQLPDQPGKAAMYGAGQGLLFGYLPQVKAAVQTGSFSSPEYIKNRDASLDEIAKLQESNPYAYGLANAGGFLATSMVPMGALAKAGQGIMTATKLAQAPKYIQAGAKLAGMAGIGAAEAGLMNPGDIRGELSGPQLDQRLNNAGTGAKLGLLGGAGAEAVRAGAKAAKVVSNVATVRATGGMFKDIKKLYNKGTFDEISQFLRDKGIVGAGDTFETVTTKAKALKESVGQVLDKVYSKAVQTFDEPDFISKLSPEQQQRWYGAGFFPASQRKEILDRVAAKIGDKTKARKAIADVQAYLDDLAAKYGDDVDIRKANEIKGDIDSDINYFVDNADSSASQAAFKEVRNFINDKIKAQVDFLDETIGGDLGKTLRQANKEYGFAKTAEGMALRKIARENTNQAFGLTDKIAGGVGVTMSGAGSDISKGDYLGAGQKILIGGLLGAGANKFGRTYGPGLISGLGNASSKFLQGTAPVAGKAPMGLLSPIMQQQMLEEYSQPQNYRLTGK